MYTCQPQYSSHQPRDPVFADDELTQRVGLFLLMHGNVDSARVCLSVHAGRVTLRGDVASLRQKEVIEACSRRVAGVLTVINKLSVADERIGRRQRLERETRHADNSNPSSRYASERSLVRSSAISKSLISIYLR
jgi:hypothetical protein